jgi:hypothetical protein
MTYSRLTASQVESICEAASFVYGRGLGKINIVSALYLRVESTLIVFQRCECPNIGRSKEHAWLPIFRHAGSGKFSFPG